MSSLQWAGVMAADESYAGSPEFLRLRDGCSARSPAFSTCCRRIRDARASGFCLNCSAGPASVVPNNAHFDTTRANIEHSGAEAVDLPIAEARQPRLAPPVQGKHGRRRARSADRASRPREYSGGDVHGHQQQLRRPAGEPGKPACDSRSLRSISACRSSSTPAALPRTPGSSSSGKPDSTIGPSRAIVRDMFDLADGATISAKKDGMVNIGGVLLGARRGPVSASEQPADPHRRLCDVRRPCRSRPGGDGTRLSGSSGRGLSLLSDSQCGVRRRKAVGGGNSDHRAAGRARHLHRRGRLLPAHPGRRNFPDRRWSSRSIVTRAFAASRSAR